MCLAIAVPGAAMLTMVGILAPMSSDGCGTTADGFICTVAGQWTILLVPLAMAGVALLAPIIGLAVRARRPSPIPGALALLALVIGFGTIWAIAATAR
ncbi:hypothetical protein Afil01_17400 [Actinorhabdospora filicis]|uniref:Uncharacterized protein n=1 Tax=Actinorhabdospora filicis TaxID=1785913 RepID=A0A9W6SJ41_9ACTN|nr:hypothetical protein Afil01_17400 [Actinorhabdospora filicis]